MPNTEYIVKSKFPSFEIPNISIGEHMKTCLHKVISLNPNTVALIDQESGSTLNYAELDELANKTASGLQSCLGAHLAPTRSNKSACMFFSENSFECIASLLACSYLGVTIIPIAPSYGSYELCQQMAETQAEILLIGHSKLPVLLRSINNEKYSHLVHKLRTLIIMDRNVDEAKVLKELSDALKSSTKIITFHQVLHWGNDAKLDKIPQYEVKPQLDPFLVMYTSGSTGKAKGIIHSHRSFLACIISGTATNHQSLFSGIILNLNYPLGHMSGVTILFKSLQHGTTLVVFNRPVSSETILSAVEKYHISCLSLSATLSVDLLKTGIARRFNLSSVKHMLYGGAKFPENISLGLAEKYAVRIHEGYGATEFMNPLKNLSSTYQPGNLGSPAANVEMKVIHLQTAQSLPAELKGEVCFRGSNCFVGYVQNDQAYREVVDNEGWYHTGDIGYYDKSGSLFLLDRLNELIKYKYFSVAAAEVESFLMTHDAIKEVCVIGVKHATEGYHTRAYVQLVSDKSVTEREIVQYAQDNIAYHNWLNGGVRFVPEMPHISIGKIDRQYFKQLVKDEVLTVKAPKYE